jgi:hypothetical protein
VVLSAVRNISPFIFCILSDASVLISGSVLTRLKRAFSQHDISAPVSKRSQMDLIRDMGVTPLFAPNMRVPLDSEESRSSLKDLIEWVAQSDVVINCADSDSDDLTRALLEGFKKRNEKGARGRAVLIHTSGVAVFLDKGTEGKHNRDLPKSSVSKIFLVLRLGDLLCSRIRMKHSYEGLRPLIFMAMLTSRTLSVLIVRPAACSHAIVRILRAGESTSLNTYIISPAAVVGQPSGPIEAASFFIKAILAISNGYDCAAYCGEGSNQFYVVRIFPRFAHA